jgi:hypothetical protein
VRACSDRTPEDVQQLEALLSCVTQIVNTHGIGLPEIMAVPNALKHIVLCLEHIGSDQKLPTVEFFCALCLLTEDSWRCGLFADFCLLLHRHRHLISHVDRCFFSVQ